MDLEIRECKTVDELAGCVQLQRDVFALPELEISPVRHFIVTRSAGGWTLGAFSAGELVGFVLSVPAYLRNERAYYSHMTAVRSGDQGKGIGAKLKWAQRDRALADGVKYIKWTFEPVKARNASFNLEKLGAVVREYQNNFYGTDYSTASTSDKKIGLASDRLFAEWPLEGAKVRALASNELFVMSKADREIVIPNDWSTLVKNDLENAVRVQLQVRSEFESAFAEGLICRGFRRSEENPAYLLYRDQNENL
ncbi:MAG: GNAT family N-acetyltransferase [Pyrinomonadaceae bacterium]